MLPKWKTSRRLLLGFGLLIFILALTALISYQQIQRVDRDVEQVVDVDGPLEQAVLEMKISAGETARAVFDYVRDEDPTNREMARDAEVAFETSAAKFDALAQTEDEKELGQEVARLYEEFTRSGYEIMTLVDQRHTALQVFREDVKQIDHAVGDSFQSAIDRTALDGMNKLEAALEMEAGIDEAFSLIEAHIAEPDPMLWQEILDAQAHFEQFALVYQETSLSAYEESWLSHIGDDFEEAVNAGNEIIAGTDRLHEQLGQFEQDLGGIAAYIDGQVQPFIHAQAVEAALDAKSSTNAATKWLLGISIIGILIGSVSAWTISKWIVKRLQELFRGIEIAGSGKLDHRMSVDAKGEFGQLALAFNRMLNELERSTDALRKNEETAWTLLNATCDSAMLMDSRGIILASNKLAAKRYGKTIEGLTGLCLYDLLPADLVVSTKAKVTEVLRTGTPLHFEDEREGMILDQCIYPVFGVRGKVIRLAIFARDITVRKWVDEVAEEIRRRNELILEAAGDGIYGVDSQGKTTFVNAAAARMLGYKPDELIGRSHHEIVHHSRPDGTPYPHQECPIYAAFKDGTIHSGDDEVFWRKDGTCFPVAYSSTPMIEKGRIVGAVVTYQDITKRKRVEESLRQSEKKYRSILENSDNVIISVNKEGRVVDCNSQAQQLLGYTPSEIIGQSLIDIFHPDSSTQARDLLKEVLITGFGRHKTYRMVKKDATLIEVHMNAVAVSDDRGEYVRTVCMISDITWPRSTTIRSSRM